MRGEEGRGTTTEEGGEAIYIPGWSRYHPKPWRCYDMSWVCEGEGGQPTSDSMAVVFPWAVGHDIMGSSRLPEGTRPTCRYDRNLASSPIAIGRKPCRSCNIAPVPAYVRGRLIYCRAARRVFPRCRAGGVQRVNLAKSFVFRPPRLLLSRFIEEETRRTTSLVYCGDGFTPPGSGRTGSRDWREVIYLGTSLSLDPLFSFPGRSVCFVRRQASLPPDSAPLLSTQDASLHPRRRGAPHPQHRPRPGRARQRKNHPLLGLLQTLLRLGQKGQQRRPPPHLRQERQPAQRQRQHQVGLRERRQRLHVQHAIPLGRQRDARLRLGRRQHPGPAGVVVVLRVLRAHLHGRAGAGQEDDCAGEQHGRGPGEQSF